MADMYHWILLTVTLCQTAPKSVSGISLDQLGALEVRVLQDKTAGECTADNVAQSAPR